MCAIVYAVLYTCVRWRAFNAFGVSVRVSAWKTKARLLANVCAIWRAGAFLPHGEAAEAREPGQW